MRPMDESCSKSGAVSPKRKVFITGLVQSVRKRYYFGIMNQASEISIPNNHIRTMSAQLPQKHQANTRQTPGKHQADILHIQDKCRTSAAQTAVKSPSNTGQARATE